MVEEANDNVIEDALLSEEPAANPADTTMVRSTCHACQPFHKL